MDRSELGRKIKEARLAKKLTQAEVAGTFITRNMLSQIESGAANPSLKTLEYLTTVLDIPIQNLLPDRKGEETDENILLPRLAKCKSLFDEGDYLQAVSEAEGLVNSELRDEAYAVAARSYISMAEKAEKEGKFSEAADMAYKAYDMADKGFYASRDIKTLSALLTNRIAEKIGK